MNNQILKLEIFSAGIHQAANGEKIEFTHQDLVDMANIYDVEIFEAPIVIGHPALNAPAYGWVKSLEVNGDKLEACIHAVDEIFKEWVNKGLYKKVSASFYMPESTNNPKAGHFYLRHIGFLGACPPAVKGLREISFMDTSKDFLILEDEEEKESKLQKLVNRAIKYALMNFIRKNNKVEDVDRLSTRENHLIQPLNQDKQEILKVNLENKNLKEEISKLKQRLGDEHSFQVESKDIEEFVNHLIETGRIMPRDKDALIKIIELSILEDQQVLHCNFNETKSGSLFATLYQTFNNLPKHINFSEFATTKKRSEECDKKTFFVKYMTDPERMRIHKKISELSKEKNIPYDVAAKSIIK